MADVPSALKDWSATASSNSPTDATTIGAGLADNLQALQAVVRGDLATKGSDIGSSANPDVAAVQGLYHDITGNNTITGLGSGSAGIWKILQFDSSPVLKNSTALAMITAADVTASPGAVGVFFCEATSQWRNVSFIHATAGSLVPAASTVQAGVAELATNAEALTGTDTGRVVTVSALESVLGMKKLSSGTVTSTAVADVTMTGFTSYANKVLVFRNFRPVTDNVALFLRTSTDGGATYDAGASDYHSEARGIDSSGTTLQAAASGAAQIQLNTQSIDNSTASGGINGAIEFFDMTNTAVKVNMLFRVSNWNTTASAHCFGIGGGSRNAAGDVDAVRLLFGSGNIDTGSWVLYGLT